MKNLSKLALTLASTCYFTIGTAHTPLNSPSLVTIPTLTKAYEISASALWLQPSSSSLDYGIHTRPLPIENPHWVIRSINHNYKLGFDVGLGFIFPQSANNMELTWAHLSQSKSSADSDSSPDFMGPFFQIGPDANTIHSVEGHSKFKYDVINFEIGQFVNFGCRMQSRFFTGISGTSIQQNLTSIFAGDSVDPRFSLKTDNISKFTGVGPRFGISNLYHFTPSIGLVAEIAGSAYLGRMRSSLESVGTATVLAAAGINANPQSINTDNATRLVPAADGKLGLNYHLEFDKETLFKLEAGYKFAAYFNAIREVYPSTLAEVGGIITPIQTGGIFVGTMGQSQSNFAVNGPYLNGSVSFS
ncbi:Lpg1974 family pore-forming outer membrane protein [Candidatus Berkiella aquae]|uniref:Legionella pneumophila major outer membrane protein n=1 Tax=Candidatus Berkiella aquae TaxID=295108 RepID=A0A0Q9YYA8_9GAMM|nr:Lpg1974 family pore-forming outer membrane protein [Candidatus Berkiella aquae]MCS5711177.1 hypothetical protein [Candidatus Berkiella aquae]